MNLVAESRGGRVTLTLNPHDPLCEFASRAVQATAVEPTWNIEPLAGWQLMTYGPVPPVTEGAG
jgi:hypothetical protein